MFRKVLIANRGEIACRVMRTARRMGIGAVAVYSEADTEALHVRLSDEAWPIGAAPPRESYLSVDKLIDVARRSGAEAVHPGYGFLSESAEFAARCRQAGLIFIGPSPEAMRAIGSKADAKKLMGRIGIPIIPGFHEESQTFTTFAEAAKAIGFPIVVKASAGGGGRGMRVVCNADELAAAMEGARREAVLAFGDGRLLIEKYLERPRHVEVQIVADNFGNVVTFSERDCSLQRNHQKLVEETPAPRLGFHVGRSLREAAVEIARASSYAGAGTVEFLIKGDAFYFLEVNARLQVEHPVTEMISGIDFVEWQFRVASGERLPLMQDQLRFHGCAIEARICAEDPAENFRPSSGVIEHLKLPLENAGVRVDIGVQTGDRISPYYDSLVGKLIVWDEERAGAVRKMQRLLEKVELVGVASNLDFLRALVSDARFIAGLVETGMVGDVGKSSPASGQDEMAFVLAAAAAAWLEDVIEEATARAGQRGEPWSPWAVADAWRMHGASTKEVRFRYDEQTLSCRMSLIDNCAFWMETPSGRIVVSATACHGRFVVGLDGVKKEIGLVRLPTGYVVIHAGRNHLLEWLDPLAQQAVASEKEKSFVAPLPARVTRIFVKEGDHIAKGSPVLVLEAMKMEIPMNAPGDGLIEKVLCSEGQSVHEGEKLLAMAEER